MLKALAARVALVRRHHPDHERILRQSPLGIARRLRNHVRPRHGLRHRLEYLSIHTMRDIVAIEAGGLREPLAELRVVDARKALAYLLADDVG